MWFSDKDATVKAECTPDGYKLYDYYLESFGLCTEPILLCSDFNIQVDVQDNPNVESFLDLIDFLGLVQHVHFVTHVQGHTLDLVITRKNGQYHSRHTDFKLFFV
ncbi:unnamed protein product [Porites evermanni]|uniref:Uncharacterized protein n=1 Tax=Porites evermanni TaxID=104178 RepID=A0ABN8SZ85_9CNID|nr:unnamed protein product [Porites evermanni]